MHVSHVQGTLLTPYFKYLLFLQLIVLVETSVTKRHNDVTWKAVS